jgi:hypothetical protein
MKAGKFVGTFYPLNLNPHLKIIVLTISLDLFGCVECIDAENAWLLLLTCLNLTLRFATTFTSFKI